MKPEMEPILADRTNSKLIRKLVYKLPLFFKVKNYVIPTSLEDLKSQERSFWLGPQIMVKGRELYLNEECRTNLDAFVDILFRLIGIKDTFSYGFLYKKVLKRIERDFASLADGKVIDPKQSITTLLSEIIDEYKSFEFFFVINGITIDRIPTIRFGNTDLFMFSEISESHVQQYKDFNNQNEWYDNTVDNFIKENFLGKPCIKVIAYGDRDQAEEIAKKLINQTLNILRFLVCLFIPDRIHEHLINIRIVSGIKGSKQSSFNIDSDKMITLSFQSLSTIELPLDPDKLDDLNNRCFFSDLLSLLSNEKKTEIEEAILSSIHWIGEAQNDHIDESAFIKYWTAIETLFSRNEILGKCSMDITESLAAGISVQLALGGYKFIEVDDMRKTYLSVKKLYKKRSKIIHAGIYGHVEPQEIVEVCKYAVWCTLTYLGLRTLNYTKLNEVYVQINRLFNLVKERGFFK